MSEFLRPTGLKGLNETQSLSKLRKHFCACDACVSDKKRESRKRQATQMFTPYLEPFVRGLEVSNLSNVSAFGSIVQKQNANKKKSNILQSYIYYIFKQPHNNLNDYKIHSFYIFTQISV